MDYQHIIYVEEREEGTYLKIDRLFGGNRRDFMMEFEVGEILHSESDQAWDALEQLALSVGRNVCIDSPTLRSKLGI